MDVYIVRHGFSTSNAGLDDSIDPALTQMGMKQAAKAGERLADIPFDAVLVSPLLRTAQTAIPIVKQQPNPPVIQLLETLMEVDTSPNFRPAPVTKYSMNFQHPFSKIEEEEYLPCAEDNTMRHIRGKRVMDYVKNHYGGNDRVLLVTHGTFIRYILKAALGLDADFPIRFTISNCSVTKIVYKAGEQPRLVAMNDTRHLPYELLSEEAVREIYR